MEQQELRRILTEAANVARRAYPDKNAHQIRDRETCMLLDLAERAGLDYIEFLDLMW